MKNLEKQIIQDLNTFYSEFDTSKAKDYINPWMRHDQGAFLTSVILNLISRIEKLEKKKRGK